MNDDPGTDASIPARGGMIFTKLLGRSKVAASMVLSSAAFIQGSSSVLISYPYIEDSGIATDIL